MLNSGSVERIGKSDLGKAITMECPLCEMIIEGNKIQLSKGFKGFTQEDVNISKSMVRLQTKEVEEDRDKGVKEDVSGCKNHWRSYCSE